MKLRQQKSGRSNKRKIIFPNILNQADLLGVNRTHLWRVLTGERESPDLLHRFDLLIKASHHNSASVARPASKPLPPPIELAAAENLAPTFFTMLQKLGFELVIVHLQVAPTPRVFPDAEEIPSYLQIKLQKIRAGQFDSSYFPIGSHYHFFHVTRSDLGRAMQALKSGLDARELLPITTLFHAETVSEWRKWFPGDTAEMVETGAEAES
jgi:hypothetical protein